MRRSFWLAVGLGAGVTAALLVRRWVQRQTQAYAPANLARQAASTARDAGSLVGEALKEFRAGMAEKEVEVRGSLVE
jgi:hypothetical protein